MWTRFRELFGQFVRPLSALAGAPAGLWYVIGAFVVDSIAYFGILTLMTTFFGTDLHWPDAYATMTVSLFTMLVTLFMLGVGSFAESFGLRWAVAVALLLGTVGRAVYCLLPGIPSLAAAVAVAVLSLLLAAAGEGILMPTCYSGVKQFTDEKTSSMGYALIYALMNLGIVVAGWLSAWVRPGVQAILDRRVGMAVALPSPSPRRRRGQSFPPLARFVFRQRRQCGQLALLRHHRPGPACLSRPHDRKGRSGPLAAGRAPRHAGRAKSGPGRPLLELFLRGAVR
jgi:MFS family permease